MFNALRSDELLVGIGRVLRLVGAAPGALEEYERSQTLSAYSVTRLLAAEQAAAAELLTRTKTALAEALAGDDRPPVVAAAHAIAAATDGIAVGDAVSVLLGELPRPDPLRPGVQRALAAMIDDEVTALGAARR
ncbi:MAG TPA: hypothetical protein VFN55_09300 [Solirubrobacteraceae bacterium]|nr:hypothetical protein [Solirubrobacteraceae bacterium]